MLLSFSGEDAICRRFENVEEKNSPKIGISWRFYINDWFVLIHIFPEERTRKTQYFFTAN